MPLTPVPTPVAVGTPIPPEWFEEVQAAVLPVTVAALPVAPVDGQVVFFQNAAMLASGAIWPLRYTPSMVGDHKWLPVGPTDLIFLSPLTCQQLDSGSAWTQTLPNTLGSDDVPTPIIEAPLDGTYVANLEGWVKILQGSTDYAVVALTENGWTPGDDPRFEAQANTDSPVQLETWSFSFSQAFDVSAGDNIGAIYSTTAAGGFGAQFGGQALRLTPIALG